ncbi:MAG: hypothetical protein ACRDPB_03640, partial [Nocardioidaceae bacterium]
DNSAALWHLDADGLSSPRTPPPGLPGNPGLTHNDGVQILAFEGPDTGLAITGTLGDKHHDGRTALYVTDDGARSWTRVNLPTREQPVRIAVGGGAAYALTTYCPRPSAACDHATLWSIDPTGASAPHTFDSLPTDTHTSGPNTVAAFGPHVWAFLNMGAGNGTLWRSENGGRTWRRSSAGPCLAVDPIPTSGGVLWSECWTGLLARFSRRSAGGQPLGVFSGVGGTSNSTLLPLSDTVADAVIEDRHGTRVEVTRDAGRSQTTVATIPHDIARRGFQATFVSRKVGYLVTYNGGQVYRTADGALTWSKLTPPHR